MTMHLLTGHMLDKPLYLNAGLKKRAIHHILFIWQQVITICCQIERNISVVRDF